MINASFEVLIPTARWLLVTTDMWYGVCVVLLGDVVIWRWWSSDWSFCCVESWLQFTVWRQHVLHCVPGTLICARVTLTARPTLRARYVDMRSRYTDNTSYTACQVRWYTLVLHWQHVLHCLPVSMLLLVMVMVRLLLADLHTMLTVQHIWPLHLLRGWPGGLEFTIWQLIGRDSYRDTLKRLLFTKY